MRFQPVYEIDPTIFYAATIILIAGAAEFGNWIGRRYRGPESHSGDIGTLTAAALGLLALLIAFSFSIALSHFDVRRQLVLDEANAIGSTANFARMLPETAQEPVLDLLRDYAALRATLGVSPDPSRMERDVAQSLDIQAKLWRQAVTASAAAPQSLPVNRFVASLNEMNNIHESRLTALHYSVPGAVMGMLVFVAMVAMGFTGYDSGVAGAKRRLPDLIMSFTIAVLITLVADLDEPLQGLIKVPVQPLLDAAQGIGP